ncbi:unnamed protein product [Fraxinus pennsylvanica]|uniref:Uncharacterized protein n=1 Tax=Fraxinus pennsylvanica TaxID=56036 RepID=A0AAD2DIS8_9LAMI|nr:unnamed protein product [Fraxinus pennsylvanica]
MADTTKKRKKGSISEEDVSTLLQRYSSQTVLALLQEVAVVSERKIDWNAMVKNTSTGISNPREYQKLWRHLAYRDDLVDSLNNAANPLVININPIINRTCAYASLLTYIDDA